MTYSPGNNWEPVPPMVSGYTFGLSPIAHERVLAATPASGTWESANRAVYVPVIIPATCVARRVWWVNGVTTTGGATVEVGIYLDNGYKPGTKMISGSATQGTASEVQFVDITDTTLSPGLCWLAIVCSTSTNTTIFGSSMLGAGYDAACRFQEASAYPLPATATPAESAATGFWVFGFATTASP